MTEPALKGGLLALAAALLFGLSTPLVQYFGHGQGAFTTAALLYGRATVVALLMRHPPEREARLRRHDAPRIMAIAFFGAVIGPVALAWGLQHTSGSSALLTLTLEAFFTALLAWRLYGEVVDKRVFTAMLLLLLGGVVLVLEQGVAGRMQLWGLLAVLIVTAAWGVDNTLSRMANQMDRKDIIGSCASYVGDAHDPTSALSAPAKIFRWQAVCLAAGYASCNSAHQVAAKQAPDRRQALTQRQSAQR